MKRFAVTISLIVSQPAWGDSWGEIVWGLRGLLRRC